MKKTQLKKFLFMFVIGLSLLFSYSNAEEFELNTVYTSPTNPTNNMTTLTLFDSTTSLSDGYDLIYKYINDTETYKAEFNKLIQSSLDYYSCTHYVLVVKNGFTYLVLYNSLDIDIAMFGKLGFTPYAEYYRFVDNHSSTSTSNSAYYYKHTGPGLCTVANINESEIIFLESNDFIKETTYSAGKFYMTGNYYYEPVFTEPDGPDFEGISDTEKATIINSIVNSDEFSTVPDNYRNQFFIVYNTWTGRYKIYFYPEQYYLKGRIFEEGETSEVSYKSYKIIAFEGSNILWDLWQSINPFDYYVFSGYFNEDETFNSYFYEYKDSHQLNQYYFSCVDEPIVYTSRDIGFVIYNLETGEYDEDLDNSVVSTILKDDEGNEIVVDIPENNSSVSDTPWNRFISVITSIPQQISSEFGKFSGLTKIVSIISPISSALYIILGVLLSSISFLSRAVAFVYTLPTIEASDALFLVDVDAAVNGISFVGNSWGANFLQGLNMVRKFSWNGLNLWTLFTSFIVAIFAIYCIKLVRKHYHY